MKLDNKTLRGKLVEVISKSIIEDYLFKLDNGFNEALQTSLIKNLAFEVKSSLIEHREEYSFIQISYIDEDDIVKIVHITIEGNSIKI